ncbi:TPA: hypothetical protein QH056_001829 [Klebsiella oxytoca]|nr:hypothetical protein [Klebsiella oxytoca]
MKEFTYYNHKGRLIRVNESDLKHFRDITPYIEFPLNEKVLKASYKKWIDRDFDNGDWVLIGTYVFGIDNDSFMKMYNSFKGVADYKKPRKKRTVVTPELIASIKRKKEAGATNYSIASDMGVSEHTVKKYITA